MSLGDDVRDNYRTGDCWCDSCAHYFNEDEMVEMELFDESYCVECADEIERESKEELFRELAHGWLT